MIISTFYCVYIWWSYDQLLLLLLGTSVLPPPPSVSRLAVTALTPVGGDERTRARMVQNITLLAPSLLDHQSNQLSKMFCTMFWFHRTLIDNLFLFLINFRWFKADVLLLVILTQTSKKSRKLGIMNPSIYRQFINQIISILDVDNVEICILLPILSVIKIFKLTLSQTLSPFVYEIDFLL